MMANVNVELVDFNGNTSVHLACYTGKLDCLRILSNYVLMPKLLNTINYDGKFLLFLYIINYNLI